MKKNYYAPKAEMVKFDYNNQVVASGCTQYYHTSPEKGGSCQSGQSSYKDNEST